jgi:uncharacterized protein
VAATRFLVEGALQTWLGDVIAVEDLAVEARDSTLLVELRYTNRRTGLTETASLTTVGPA